MEQQPNEIKAFCHTPDPGYYREIWKGLTGKGNEIWIMRDTQDGYWSYLSSGPDGYCEPENSIPKNVDILICNNDWEVFYRTGNDKERFPDGFPTFEQVCEKHWASIKEDHLPTVGTPELKAWLDEVEPDGLSYLDSINWNYHRYNNIDPDFLMVDDYRVSREDKGDFKTTILLQFDYMGRQYHIARKAVQHSMCNARWYVYVVVKLVDGKFDGNCYWFGFGLISNK